MADKFNELVDVVASYMPCENCLEYQGINSVRRMDQDFSDKLNTNIPSLCTEEVMETSFEQSFALLSNRKSKQCLYFVFKNLMEKIIKIKSTTSNVAPPFCPYYEFEIALNASYDQNEDFFKKETLSPYGFTFSPSVWINTLDNKSYLTFSCNYVNSEGLFRSVKYYTSELSYEQTSSDVMKLFNTTCPIMQQYYQGLLVIDYSQNMLNDFKEYGQACIPCICKAVDHCIQNVLKTLIYDDYALEDEEKPGDFENPYDLDFSDSLIYQCLYLVSHFQEKKLQNNLPRSLQSCSTLYWMEVLKMLELVESQWDIIVDILAKRNELKLFDLDAKSLRVVVDFLKIFRNGYNELSSMTSPTLNLVLVWIIKWKTYCLQNQDKFLFLHTMKCLIDQKINITMYHNIATMLDPRYKDLSFLSEKYRLETRAVTSLLVQECHVTLQMRSIPNSDNDMSEFYNDTNFVAESEDKEVKEYLHEEFAPDQLASITNSRYNPLQYWDMAKTRYPNLSKVALWILSCPASSIQIVGKHTISDCMVTKHEINLPSEGIHKYLFVKSFRSLHS